MAEAPNDILEMECESGDCSKGQVAIDEDSGVSEGVENSSPSESYEIEKGNTML